MFGFILKQYLENFTFLIKRILEVFTCEVCIPFKNLATFQHIILFVYICKQTCHMSRVSISQKVDGVII